jgi:hypothetical protein
VHKATLKTIFVVYREGVAKLCRSAPKAKQPAFLLCCQMLPCGLAQPKLLMRTILRVGIAIHRIIGYLPANLW